MLTTPLEKNLAPKIIKKENLIKEAPPKSKIEKWHDEIFSLTNGYNMLSGIHLDIYLSIFQNFKMFKSENKIADMNLVISWVLLSSLMLMVGYFAFKNHRAV
jgi:hypothetical protein